MKHTNFIIKKNSIIDFSILFLLTSLIALRSISGVMYLAQLLFLVIMALKIKEDGLYLNNYIIFSFMFIIWAAASIFWSVKNTSTIKGFIPLLQITAICILLIQYYIKDSIVKVDKILKYFCVASIILVIIIVLKTPISSWIDIMKETTDAATSKGRLGPSVGYQPNGLGIILSFSSIIWLYFITNNKSKFSILMYSILSILVIFTKSRKALMILLFGSIFYLFFYKKRSIPKTFSTIIITIIIIVLSIWGVLNIPFLYKMVGFRLVGIFSIFNPSYVADASVSTRDNMINVGVELFSKNPIKGVGLNNFSYYYYYLFGGWAETYSHNNYIEILSGLGIVGFILYYLIPFRILYLMILKCKQFVNYNRKLYVLMLTIIIIRLIIDYGMVVYDDEFIQLLTVTLYCNISALNFITKQSTKNKMITEERRQEWI